MSLSDVDESKEEKKAGSLFFFFFSMRALVSTAFFFSSESVTALAKEEPQIEHHSLGFVLPSFSFFLGLIGRFYLSTPLLSLLLLLFFFFNYVI